MSNCENPRCESFGCAKHDESRKYRKKPVVISARISAGEEIDTLEGTMTASPGDYVITGVQGEEYPCKPDIFMDTYEPISTKLGDTEQVKEAQRKLRTDLEDKISEVEKI